MGFGTITFTSRGRALQAKAVAGTELHFNRISVGDGQLSGQAVEELSSLIHEVKSLAINELRVLSGNKAKIGGVLSNQGLATGFYWRELGVYAQDPDLGEILYCYGNAGTLAEYIPSQGGSEILEKQVNVIAIVGSAANITAIIDQSLIFATKQELNEKISHSLATAAGDFLVASKAGQFIKKTVAEIKTLLGLGSAAYKNFDSVGGVAAYDTVQSHLSDYVRQPGYGTTAGSANTYILTLSPALTAYTAGVCVAVKIHAANTGTSTININGLGAKSIMDSKGAVLVSGKLKLGVVYTLRYDGINFILQGEGGEYGTAGAAQVLSGYTIGTDSGLISGTIPMLGGEEYAGWRRATVEQPSMSGRVHLAIPKGAYLDGANNGKVGVFCDDPNFIASNFRADKNVLGLQGAIPVKTPDIASHVNALNVSAGAYSGDGQNCAYLQFTDVDKYFQGAQWVRLIQPELLPQNIVAGKNIMGVAGTYNGKKWAKGSALLTTGKSFRGMTGSTYNMLAIVVTGLNFKPSTVIIKYEGPTFDVITLYSETDPINGYPKPVRISNYSSDTQTSINYKLKGDVGDAYVTYGGFCLPTSLSGAGSLPWEAYE